ncbi:MAG: MOSC domain-containing protein [Planctomycetota bacterium]
MSEKSPATGQRHHGTPAEVVAVCISSGGIPKTARDTTEVTVDGLVGDGRNHEKHAKPHRAVSIQDIELFEELKAEGFAVGPGIMGENLTVRGLHVQRMSPGDRLGFENGPLIELTEVRRPCFVLDEIDPRLEKAVVGRCGFLARVLRTGRFFPGQRIRVNGDGR